MYAITVYQVDAGRRTDLANFTRASTAPEMEEVVTDLHRRFPSPGFEVVVENQ